MVSEAKRIRKAITKTEVLSAKPMLRKQLVGGSSPEKAFSYILNNQLSL